MLLNFFSCKYWKDHKLDIEHRLGQSEKTEQEQDNWHNVYKDLICFISI